jgi:hypothetical protein
MILTKAQSKLAAKSLMLAVRRIINYQLLDTQKSITNVAPSLPYEVQSLKLLLRQ